MKLSVLAVLVGAASGVTSALAQFPGTRDAQESGVSVEALSWAFKASPTPVAVVTDGLLDAEGTSLFLGGGSLDANRNSGLKVTGFRSLSAQSAVEASAFLFRSRSGSRTVSSSGQLGSIDLLVPFFDLGLGRENYTELSFSPIYSGEARAEITNSLGGVEITAVRSLPSPGALRTDLLAGLRYLRLREKYAIDTSSPWTPPRPPDIWLTNDTWDAKNDFYGAQFGVRARYDDAQWFALGTAKVSVGTVRQSVRVDGSLATDDFSAPGDTQVFPGGYFALPGNIGKYSRSVFSAVPEGSLVAGLRVNPSTSVFVGLHALYLRNAARPGEHVDRRVNPTATVSHTGDPAAVAQGPAQPPFEFRGSNFWAHGISAGVAIRF